MFRGRAALLQHSVKSLEPVVRVVAHAPEAVWHADADDYSPPVMTAMIKEYRELSASLPGGRSQTLVTKTMLGAFGCVPAYDRYFRESFATATFGPKSLSSLEAYYQANAKAIDAYRVATIDFATGTDTHRRYTRASRAPRAVLPSTAITRRAGGVRDVDVAGEPADALQVIGVGQTPEDDFGGAGVPHGVGAGVPPASAGLRERLKDGHRGDAGASPIGHQVWERRDRGDVRGFVEQEQQRRVKPSAGLGGREGPCGVDHVRSLRDTTSPAGPVPGVHAPRQGRPDPRTRRPTLPMSGCSSRSPGCTGFETSTQAFRVVGVMRRAHAGQSCLPSRCVMSVAPRVRTARLGSRMSRALQSGSCEPL